MKDILVNVIRLGYPCSIQDELFEVTPMKPPELDDPEDIMRVIEGMIHIYGEGFKSVPYQLCIQTIQRHKNRDIYPYYYIVNNTVILEEAKTEKEFQSVKEDWQKRIKEFKEIKNDKRCCNKSI